MLPPVHIVALSLSCLIIAAANNIAIADDRNVQSAAQKINAANELLRNGKPAEALSVYQEIEEVESLNAEILYNQAVALYRQGDLNQASKLFSTAASDSNPQIAASSKFNLGNCAYQRSLDLANQDPNAAIGELQQAIAHYRGALRTDPNNTDARVNIELAIKQIEQLTRRQSSQPDETKNKQKQQQNEQQQNEQQQSEQKQSEQQQSEQQQSEQEQSEQELSEQDQQRQEQGEQNQSEQGQQGTETGEAKQESQPDQAAGNSDEENRANDGQEAEGASQQKELSSQDESATAEEAQEASDDPTEPATPSTGDLTPAGDPATSPANAQAQKEKLVEPKFMTAEEALKLLQSVRDRDMLRRLQRQQIEKGRRVPVERDW